MMNSGRIWIFRRADVRCFRRPQRGDDDGCGWLASASEHPIWHRTLPREGGATTKDHHSVNGCFESSACEVRLHYPEAVTVVTRPRPLFMEVVVALSVKKRDAQLFKVLLEEVAFLEKCRFLRASLSSASPGKVRDIS